MLKQQTIPTSLGQLTVSSLTLGELRQLDSLFPGEVFRGKFRTGFIAPVSACDPECRKKSAPGPNRGAA